MTGNIWLGLAALLPVATVASAPATAQQQWPNIVIVWGDQQLTGLRYDNWKLVFMEQRAPGTLRVWAEPFTDLRVPKLFNLRTDPYERADITSNTYYDWFMDHAFLMVPAQNYVGQFLATFKDYPQRQKPASFNMDQVLEKLKEPGSK
jgi:hypothetical protein